MTPATTNVLPALAGRRSARVVARSLFALTKPRIIELLLVTTIPTMLLAQRGLPSVRLLVVTLVGRGVRGREREHHQLLHRP